MSVDSARSARPGDWVDTQGLSPDAASALFRMQIPTDRYTSSEFVARERQAIWMRVWQVVGREDEFVAAGAFKEYRIFDQSFVVMRGKDGGLRGFVNACRHRGNPLFTGQGHAKQRIVCQYHLWSYDQQGALRGCSKPEIDKDAYGLLEVRVDTFAGFVFLNPDPDAAPLRDFLGEDVIGILEPYHLDQMTTVLDVREPLDCNWKVVMDAFEEGYHVSGIHPQLLRVLVIDPTKTRYRFLDRHSVAVAPFEVAHVEGMGPDKQVEGIMELPETFPGVVRVLPRFTELVDRHRSADGVLTFPDGVTGRTLLQQATRDTLSRDGLDVDGLTDAQMSDNHGWVLFPNFFMTIRAGEATVIMSTPHPDGDPNRCIWHITSFMWLPPEHRTAFAAELIDVQEPGSFKYFEALQQDYDQMPRQQIGLRNDRLDHMALVNEEVVIAHYHSVIDRYLAAV
ncbi:aromatic ring-hydroxylating oxygenase subunit alpha [Mycolicibacterium neoaurum]|uniref:aromatic ring-hydroxylating oxygenase subunit alpha n=1 Tax=Mycolicibacterium neoaurum TaxID=1795 RepID=UPI003AB9A435